MILDATVAGRASDRNHISDVIHPCSATGLDATDALVCATPAPCEIPISDAILDAT
jgi:hypothetical protein